MKRLLAILLSAVFVLGITGCVKQNNIEVSKSTNDEHQKLKVEKLDYKADWIQSELEKTGLKDLSISAMVSGCFTSGSSKFSYRSYLFSNDNKYSGGNIYFHESYLAVETDSGVLLKDLLIDDYYGSYSDTMYAGDVTGDGTDEIILQQLVGMSGGAGQYLSRIFKIVDGEIKELFNSYTPQAYDTGFESRFESGFKFKIYNKFTGYSVTLDLSKSEQYYNVYFDEAGNPYKSDSNDIMIDSFREFTLQDVDADYVYEIVCSQYASLYSHVDCIGDVNSVLKFNMDTQEFEVIESEFIPFYERNDLKTSKPIYNETTYDIYQISNKYPTNFDDQILGNSIDKNYYEDIDKASTTEELINVQNKYISIWKDEMKETVSSLKTVMKSDDFSDFFQTQSDWEEQMRQNAQFDKKLIDNKAYKINLGSSFGWTWLSHIREQYRERTIYIKYLLYLIKTKGTV